MGNQRKNELICPKCNSKLGKVMISVEGAHNKILSWQCPAKDCIYIKYDKISGDKVVAELKHQFEAEKKIIKTSHQRLVISQSQ